MSNKNNKPKNPYRSLLFQLFISVIGFGAVIFFVGENVNSVIITGGITGIALAYITQLFIIYKKNKKNKEKKENIPEVDERVINNILRFSSYTSHGFIFILFLILNILMFLKIENIPTLYIWIYGFIYAAITGIGNLYIKKR
ncbi:MAG TPA: hypothetical protein VK071_00895 [Tissierellales bacterium]|nr:hypothetical protein [Tissierellales bacterium]